MHGDYGDIRYVRLFFTIEFLEDGPLPKWKASALRGGMGEMLLRHFCINGRKCRMSKYHMAEKCGFEDECIVQRIMKSKMDILPDFMSESDSIGFIFDCDDFRTEAKAGDTLEFDLTLFGKCIIHFRQILDAFFGLGMEGLGENRIRFKVVSVLNSRKHPILNDKVFDLRSVIPDTVREYIDHRLDRMGKGTGDRDIMLAINTPVTVKHKGTKLTHKEDFIRYFDSEALVDTLTTRAYILSCFEGIEMSRHFYRDSFPVVEDIRCHEEERSRAPSDTGEKMTFKGIVGRIGLRDVSDELLRLLFAGELMHIGKTTSFGLGRYRVMIKDDKE